MAPGLEEELVSQALSQGNSEEDIFQMVEYMTSTDPSVSRFKPIELDRKKIKVAIERYNLRQHYHSEDNGRRRVRENADSEAQRKLNLLINKWEQNPSVMLDTLKVKNNRSDYQCNNCFKIAREMGVSYEFIDTSTPRHLKKRVYETLVRYCTKCGEIGNKDSNKFSEIVNDVDF